MSKKIELKKTIISNQSSNNKYSKTFSKLSKSNEYIDEDKLKTAYDELFYQMSINGKASHKSIIEQSDNYIRFNYFKSLRNSIKNIIQDINEANYELEELTIPTSQYPELAPNALYDDGSFLIAGENGIKYQDMHTVYIMQEGRKRAFVGDSGEDVYNQVRRALGLPEDFSGKYYLTIEELNAVPDGPDITSTSDLNLKGNSLIVDLGDIQGLSAYYTVKIRCLGNEIQDVYNLILEENDAAVGQFYLNQEGCIIKYIFDEFTTDDVGYSIKTINLPRGEEVVLDIPRRTSIGDNVIPDNIDSLFQNPAVINYNGNEVSNYVREWGPFGRYESIIYADGRLTIEEEDISHITSTQGGQPDGIQLVNGLPSSGTGFYDIVSQTPVQEFSAYGTKRIYMAGSGLFGALNQNKHLQETIFDDLNNPYYHPEIYGQPIIRIYQRYLVLIDCYAYRSYGGIIGRSVRLMNIDFTDLDGIEQGRMFSVGRKDFRDKTGANMDYKSNTTTVYGLKWHNMDKSRVKYVGLQGVQTREYVGDRNFFNLGRDADEYPQDSNLGSNYELKGFSLNYTY